MMISPEQIKAARAMLDWSQEALAQASGLSPATIHNLEKGHISPRSAREVRRTFESKGFEFFENNGLGLNPDEIKVYKGTGSPDRFYEDMLATAKENGGEIAAIYKSQEILLRSLGVANAANPERLERLGKMAAVKCLFSEAHNTSLQVPEFQFRALPKYQIGHSSFFVCGNKYAIVLTKEGKDFTYIVMKSVDMAQSGWREFLPLWNSAVPLLNASTV